jgi:hypothetical protein
MVKRTRRNNTCNLTGGSKSKRSARHTRKKTSKGADEWRHGVMRVYKELKSKNPNAKFSDALKEASKRKKAGTL